MKQNLSKIIDYLLLNSMYILDVGLFHGKMGIVLALFAYAERCKDKLLEEYAWDLFQQVYEGVHDYMPLGLENGLSGIGYGTAFMCANGWVGCDLNAVLADIDEKIMQHDPRRLKDYSLRSGTGGIQLYLDLRRTVCGSLQTFDGSYLSELKLITEYQPKFHGELCDFLEEPSFLMTEYIEKPIGIDGGSAYYLLKESLL